MEPRSAAVRIISWYVISHHCSEILSPGGNVFFIQSSSRKPRMVSRKWIAMVLRDQGVEKMPPIPWKVKATFIQSAEWEGSRLSLKRCHIDPHHHGVKQSWTLHVGSLSFGKFFLIHFSHSNAHPIRGSFPQYTWQCSLSL